MSRQQHDLGDLVFSRQELAELGARLAHGKPSDEEDTLLLPRQRPTPFDRLVDSAFGADGAPLDRRGSSPPAPPRSEPLAVRTLGSGPTPLVAAAKGEPIASTPPPPRGVSAPPRVRTAPPRPSSMSGEIHVPQDLRATQPELPAMREGDSPFSSVEVIYPGEQGQTPVSALAAAVGRPGGLSGELPTIDDILSSTPPPQAGSAKVAVAAEAGGSLPSTQISAIEALSRAVQGSAASRPPAAEAPAPAATTPAPSSQTPSLHLDDAELDVLSDYGDSAEDTPVVATAALGAGAAAPPAAGPPAEARAQGRSSLPPPPPRSPAGAGREAEGEAPPPARSAVEQTPVDLPRIEITLPPLQREGEARREPGSPSSLAVTAQSLPAFDDEIPPAPAAEPERRAAAPAAPIDDEAEVEMLGAAAPEGPAASSASSPPLLASSAVELISLPPGSGDSSEDIEVVMSASSASLPEIEPVSAMTPEPGAAPPEAEAPRSATSHSLVTQPLPALSAEQAAAPPLRRKTPPLGMPIPAEPEAAERGASPRTPDPRGVTFDATDPSLQSPPVIESRRPQRLETTEPIRTGADARRSAQVTPEPPAPRRDVPLAVPRERSLPPVPPEAEAPKEPPVEARRPPAPPPASSSEPPRPPAAKQPPVPPPAPQPSRLAATPPPPVPGASAPPPAPPAAAAAPPPVPASSPPAPPSRPPPALTTPPPPPALQSTSVAPPPPPPLAEDGRRQKRRRGKQWFEEIFDEDYLRTLPYLTPRQTEQDVNFIVEAMDLPPASRVLDVACGYGRHAMELAARGHRVVGLDLSLPLLIRAADAARRVGVNVDFVHGDMRDMAFEGEFDAAFCYFTSFGYFDDDTNRKVAAGMCRALKPGGKLLLDLINRDYLIGDLPTRVWWQGDGCVVLEEVDFNYFTSRLQVQRQIILEDGRQLEQEISIRTYSLHEIGKVLHHAGFRVLEVSGGPALRGRFYGADSRQLLVLAEKRSDG